MKGHHQPHSNTAKCRIADAVNAHHSLLGYRALDGLKTCWTCKIKKPLPQFSTSSKKKDGYRTNCRECEAVNFKKWYEVNKAIAQEKCRQRASVRAKSGKKKLYEDLNHAKFAAIRKDWHVNNLERVKSTTNERTRKLPDYVVINKLQKGVLKNAASSDIPPELIMAKRLQILIHRKLKELKK